MSTCYRALNQSNIYHSRPDHSYYCSPWSCLAWDGLPCLERDLEALFWSCQSSPYAHRSCTIHTQPQSPHSQPWELLSGPLTLPFSLRTSPCSRHGSPWSHTWKTLIWLKLPRQSSPRRVCGEGINWGMWYEPSRHGLVTESNKV